MNVLWDVCTYASAFANRLTSVVGPSSIVSSFYNGLGDRLQQTIDSVTTNYTLDLEAGLTQVLAESTNGPAGRLYLYGAGRIGEQHADGWQYYLGDALGSLWQMAGEDSAITLARRYAPYGEVGYSQGNRPTPYGFSGEYTDSTGLIFLRARYYAPGTGRFLTRDAWEGDYQTPISLNRWVYAINNPINHTDPTGKYIHPFCPFLNMLDCLSFFGMIPDYKGIAYVELSELLYGSFQEKETHIRGKGLHPITIASAIAVQSQWLDFPLERLQDALFQLDRYGCFPENGFLRDIYIQFGLDSVGLGFAQNTYEFGNPHIMANSIMAMTERIYNGIAWCRRNNCTERDILIAAGMAQNSGFVMEGGVFNKLKEPALQPERIMVDWEEYFSTKKPLGGMDDLIYDIRAIGRTNYDTRFQLQLFTQDMIVLNSAFKWELPPGIKTIDLFFIIKLALFGKY